MCFEADWPFMWHVNEYVHRRRTNIFPKGARFPEWMWQNHAFTQFAKWLRDGKNHEEVHLFGLDCYSKDESLVDLIRFLDIYNPNMSKRVQFASPEEWPSLLSQLQWKSNKTAAKEDASCVHCSKLEQFGAEQNLECMISAEEYYAKQRLEPAGSQASW